MAIYTFVGFKQASDRTLKSINVRTAAGAKISMKPGEWADLDPDTVRQMSARFVFQPGSGQPVQSTPVGVVGVRALGTGNEGDQLFSQGHDDDAIWKSAKRWKVTAPIRDSITSGVYGAQNPCAQYDATSDTTYLAYFDGKSYWITGFVHGRREWIPRVKLADRPAAIVVDDGHAYPSMTIDGAGRIWVIFGAHNTDFQLAKSNNPRDISAWTVTSLTSGTNGQWHGSYPSLTYDSVTDCLWYAHRPTAVHSKVSATMSHEKGKLVKRSLGSSPTHNEFTVVDMSDIPTDAAADFYVQDCDAKNGKIYFTWFVAHGAAHDGTRSDVYCAYFKPSDLTIRAVDDTILTSPVGGIPTALTYAAIQDPKVRAYQHDWVSGLKHVIRDDGTVLITVNEYIPGETRCGYRVCKHTPGDSQTWRTADVGPTARSTTIYNCPAIRVEEDGTYLMFAPTGRKSEPGYYNTTGGPAGWNPFWGGDLEIYRSVDGLAWTRDRIILPAKQGGGGSGVCSVQIPRNSDPRLKAVASPGGGSFEAVHPIFAISDDPDAPVNPAYPGGDVERVGAINLVTPKNDAAWTVLDLFALIPPNAIEVLIQGFVTGDGSATFGHIGVNVRSTDTVSVGVPNGRNEFTGDARWSSTRQFASGMGGAVFPIPVGREKKIEYKTYGAATLASISLAIVGWKLR